MAPFDILEWIIWSYLWNWSIYNIIFIKIKSHRKHRYYTLYFWLIRISRDILDYQPLAKVWCYCCMSDKVKKYDVQISQCHILFLVSSNPVLWFVVKSFLYVIVYLRESRWGQSFYWLWLLLAPDHSLLQICAYWLVVLLFTEFTAVF